MSAEDIEASKAPLMDHLIELRSRLIKALLAFGIAFIVYPYDSVTMFVGSMGFLAWRYLSPKMCAALVFAVASGMLVGEGVMNVVTAIITLLTGG